MTTKVYQYKGKHYELDDSLSAEEAKAKIQSHLGETETVAAPVQQPTAPVAKQPTNVNDAVMGNPLFRMFKGAVIDPAVGSGQLLNNIGYNGAFINPLNMVSQTLQQSGLFGKDVQSNADTNARVRELEQRVTNARAAQGSTGFDWWQLGGSVLSPLNKVTGGAIDGKAGMFTKAGQAGLAGAGNAAMQPVADENFNTTKGIQVALGTVLGSATQFGIDTVGKVSSIISTLTPSGRTKAMLDYINSLAGEQRDKVVKALQEAKELVTGSKPTVAEAISDIPTAAQLAAAQRKLAAEGETSGKFAQRFTDQEAARAAALKTVAKDEATRTAAIAERIKATNPLREDALNMVDEAGNLIPKLEKQVKDEFNSLYAATDTVNSAATAQAKNAAENAAGKPGWLSAGDRAKDAGDIKTIYSSKAETIRKNLQLKQFQLKSLEDHGFFPLKADEFVSQLDSMIKNTINDDSKAVLRGVREKILSKADENGIISSRDLYENVRKVTNSDIAKFLGKAESDFANGGIPQQAARAAGNVKKMIDAEFNRSSDGLWGKYLEKYAEYSNKINRMDVGRYLEDKLHTSLDKERAGVFATAVENAAQTIKNATGNPRYDKLSQVLTEDEVKTVNSVLADLTRLDKANRLGSKVKNVDAPNTNVAGEVPNLLSRTVSLFRSAVQHLQRGNTKEFNNKMAELMLDPAAMAAFMTKEIPKGKIRTLTETMMAKMDPRMRAMFIQSFTVTPITKAVGNDTMPEEQ